MEDDSVRDKLRKKARKIVLQWEKTFLKPNSEAYICEVLDAAVGGRIPYLGQKVPPALRDAFRQFLFSSPLKDTLNRAEPVLEEEAEQLLNGAQSTPQFEQFLDELSLTARKDLSRIAERFSSHGVHVEIARDSVSVMYPASERLTWHVLCVDGEVTTISRSGTTDMRPFAISRFGAIGASTVAQLLREVYAFLVQVASNCFWYGTSATPDTR